MGLDSFFVLRKDDPRSWKEIEPFPKVNLCGGLISGNGSEGSFRGKVYENVFREITGDTLYRAEGDSEWIEDMALTLESFVENELEKYSEDGQFLGIETQDIVDLARVFRHAADNNLGYWGWW